MATKNNDVKLPASFEVAAAEYRHVSKRNADLKNRPFLAWDGEGHTDDDGDHHYMLFGNRHASISSPHLTWNECFPLLLSTTKNVINIIYGGDYDVIMMTKGMPRRTLKRLHKGKPVKYGGYRMEWRRKKWFQLSTTIGPKRSVRLYDVLSFFQTSFVKACREYLGESAELDDMEQMKLKRDTFVLNDERVKAYWTSELEHLERLMDRLRELFAAVEISPKGGWYGPGAVARALLEKQDMRRYYGELPADIVEVGEQAYYGGRFEQFKIGKFNEVWEYDIRSAYPNAITNLPDFNTAEWHHYEADNPNVRIHPYGLYCVSWKIPPIPISIGPLPWRSSKGRIYFPLNGHQSWYWGVEVLNLTYYPRKYWTLHEAWLPKWSGKIPWAFKWVEDMYNTRREMQKAGNPAQKALKLGLNSLYGKLAQSVGAREVDGEWKKPTWHNVLWAGWVTAETRHRLFSMMSQSPKHVIAVETDSVFFQCPIKPRKIEALVEITLGEGLGEWEETYLNQMLYIQNGVYYALNNTGVWRMKSRGIEVDALHSAYFWVEILARLPHETLAVTNTIRRFITDLREWNDYGNWRDRSRTTTLPFSPGKRIHLPAVCSTCRKTPELSYADTPHWLMVPEPSHRNVGSLDSRTEPSTPYAFPWREDNVYEVTVEEILEMTTKQVNWEAV